MDEMVDSDAPMMRSPQRRRRVVDGRERPLTW
jgi:hypothetical protein